MSNSISVRKTESVNVDVDVDVDVSFDVVCIQCGKILDADYDAKEEELKISPCPECTKKQTMTPAILEEVRAKFGEEVYQFLDLKRMLQE